MRLWARTVCGLASICLLVVPAVRAQERAAAKPFDLIEWNGGKFLYGVDYYPEAWDESQWEKDATMMQEAGINFVRLAEFAWVKMEPREGRFNFDWLDRALKVLNAHGIKAVLEHPPPRRPPGCTRSIPTSPRWTRMETAIDTAHAATTASTILLSSRLHAGSSRPWRNTIRIIPE